MMKCRILLLALWVFVGHFPAAAASAENPPAGEAQVGLNGGARPAPGPVAEQMPHWVLWLLEQDEAREERLRGEIKAVRDLAENARDLAEDARNQAAATKEISTWVGWALGILTTLGFGGISILLVWLDGRLALHQRDPAITVVLDVDAVAEAVSRKNTRKEREVAEAAPPDWGAE